MRWVFEAVECGGRRSESGSAGEGAFARKRRDFSVVIVIEKRTAA